MNNDSCAAVRKFIQDLPRSDVERGLYGDRVVARAYYGQCFRGVAFECYNVQKLSL